jgi:hypothetical protein
MSSSSSRAARLAVRAAMTLARSPAGEAEHALAAAVCAGAAAAASPSPTTEKWSLVRGVAPAAHLAWWRRRQQDQQQQHRGFSTAAAAAAAAAPESAVTTLAPPLNGAPPLMPSSGAVAIPQHAREAYAELERRAAKAAAAAGGGNSSSSDREQQASALTALRAWLHEGGAAKDVASRLLLPTPNAHGHAPTPAKALAPALARSFLALADRAGLSSALGREAAALAAAAPSSPSPSPHLLLLPLLLQAHALAHFPREAAARRAAQAALDLRSPPLRFPYARALKRRLVYHAGPTNSGKTFSALLALKSAARGVYCGPLRLLAMEVYETLNSEGVRCSLVTGQEVLRVPGAGHVACTVEMAALHAHSDVAVLDEIQLLGDEQRGSAWTRALLGLPANELHVCGDPSAVGLVASLASACGDTFELRRYERFRPLEIDSGGLPNGLADVQPGDCVVAFSRRAIFEARKEVEAKTGRRAAVVYGALPAETRREQARAFNSGGGGGAEAAAAGSPPSSSSSPSSSGSPPPGEQGAQVLVASDAVGLGLNFNIRRVVFHAMTKTITVAASGPTPPGAAGARGARGGGSSSDTPTTQKPHHQGGRPRRVTVPVPVTLVKQIAGRAGRRNSQWPQGSATTLKASDLPALRRALASPLERLRTSRAGLSPDAEALEALAAARLGPDARLDRALEVWQREVALDGAGRFFLCDASQLMVLARAVGAAMRAAGGGGGSARGGSGGGGGGEPAPPLLSLADRFTLAAAPVDTGDPRCVGAFVRFARDLAAGGPVRQPFRWAADGESVALPPAPPPAPRGAGAAGRRSRSRPPRPPPFPVGGVFAHQPSAPDDGSPPLRLPAQPPTTVQEMAELEAAYKVLGLWLWLSHRYDPHRFPGRAAVAEAAALLCAWLSEGLRATSALSSSSSSASGGAVSGSASEEEEVEEEQEEEEAGVEGLGGVAEEAADEARRGRRPAANDEPTPHEWRALQRRKLMGPWGQWRGVRGGLAYVGDARPPSSAGDAAAAGPPAQQQQQQRQQPPAPRRRPTSASSTTTSAHRDNALRFAHPPVPADAAALMSPCGALAGGGGGALAAAALLPSRGGAGPAGVPLPGASPAASSPSATHPHAWLIALGDSDPLAALMHSSEWDPSMSRYLRPRQHGRLVIPPPPPPPPPP